MDGYSLGLGLVVEDKPTEFSCTLSLLPLFAYFFVLPSLLHPSIFILVHTYMHSNSHNVVPFMWGSLRLTPTSDMQDMMWGKPELECSVPSA